MKASSPRSRRHRNPSTQDVQTEQQPFFSRNPVNAPGAQNKREAFFQPKLTIGQANDHYEREADAVADKVVAKQPAGVGRTGDSAVQRMVAPEEKKDVQKAEDPKKEEEKPTVQKAEAPQKEEEKPTVQKAEAPKKEEEKPTIQKMEMPEKEKKEEAPGVQKADDPKKEEEKPVQKKAQPGGSVASPSVTSQIEGTRGQGSRLPDKTRSQMEQAFGRDFSGVNIHKDLASAELNDEINAQAFTHGKDVYFNTGKFAPNSAEGQHLLAHELTHVVQQNGDTLALKENPLKNYTLAKTVWYKDEKSVDAALKNSAVLQPYIGNKLKKGFSIQDKVDYKRNEKDFEGSFKSTFPGDTYETSIRGFYDRSNNKIVVAPNPTIEILIHESIHNLSAGSTRSMGPYLNEGFTQIFTNAILNEYKLGSGKAYEDQVKGASQVLTVVGFDALAKAYFLGKTAVFDEIKRKKPQSDWAKLIKSKTEQDVLDALR
ncbi:eCIS core domain-containing protein [Spirosoma validum]|uniref:DUF4157 domain-containing protein n=1 Tax=Spirosoma validum TaxID=2771355 RepID=A0A927B0A9_9BACT|nr:DUF4157 domain-containing protein [Spirosoma validum]MBD2753186.1 DUF4157 domain-containing protein [Spirosoma validum]